VAAIAARRITVTNRNPFAVFFLTLITGGIYGIYWYASTAGEMRTRGADIPHWIWLFIPIMNIIWIVKWATGVNHVTHGTTSTGTAFLLVFLLGIIGGAMIQSSFNKVA
jgi:hypothetical protein